MLGFSLIHVSGSSLVAKILGSVNAGLSASSQLKASL